MAQIKILDKANKDNLKYLDIRYGKDDLKTFNMQSALFWFTMAMRESARGDSAELSLEMACERVRRLHK